MALDELTEEYATTMSKRAHGSLTGRKSRVLDYLPRV